jgi:hypothetical protein
MKLLVLRVLVWFTLQLRIYYAWSRVYQWLREKRKWGQVSIPLFESFEKIEEITGSMVWSKDGWRMLWDAISTPQAAYGKYLEGKKAGDCDDISIFAAYVIEYARERVDLGRTITEVGLLTCPWLTHEGDTGGHNVCAFAYRENGGVKWAYISNWYGGAAVYGLDNKKAIIRRMTSGRATVLGWAYARVSVKKQKLKLKPTEYHWGLKGE